MTVTAAAAPIRVDAAAEIVRWAYWGVANKTLPAGEWRFDYMMRRPMWIVPPTPWVAPPLSVTERIDCSTAVTLWFRLANCLDPNDLNYDGEGNTQTLFQHGLQIDQAALRPADVVVYDALDQLSMQHTALIVHGGADPLTISMGEHGDPSEVYVSQDGRVPTYLRFDTTTPLPMPTPGSPAEIIGAHRRPFGPLPLLTPGKPSPHAWDVYARELGIAYGVWDPGQPVDLGDYGPKTQEMCVAAKRKRHIPLDGTMGDRMLGRRVWIDAFGVGE
jgi:hypothetical protein